MSKAFAIGLVTMFAWWLIGQLAWNFFVWQIEIQGSGANEIRNGNLGATVVLFFWAALAFIASLFNGILCYCAAKATQKKSQVIMYSLVYSNLVILPVVGTYIVMR
jgi:hypothetical protein